MDFLVLDPHCLVSTSVAKRLVLWALDDVVSDMTPGRTNLETIISNDLFFF